MTPTSFLKETCHGHFEWNWFIHIWSFQFQWVMGFMLNIKCVISKFTIVGIMWHIFRFSCDIAAINLRYGFLKLMAANVWWHQWLCTITRFTVVITFLTGICSTDRWHRSLNFINKFMDFMLSSEKTSTVFLKNDTPVSIELIKLRNHLTFKFIKMRLLRKTLVFDGWNNTNPIVTFIGLRIRDMLPGNITENWYGGNNVIPNVSVTIGMRMGPRVEIYNTRFRMTNYPIFSIVNTVFYWYCISWNVTVNEVIMCRADGRRRLTFQRVSGRIRLSVSTVNRTYELSGTTHVTLFPKYGKHSTGPSTYGSWLRTYSKSFSCKPVLTVCSYRAQSNEIFTYGEVSRGSVPRVRRYGLLYLRAVEYDQWLVIGLISCWRTAWKDHVTQQVRRTEPVLSGTFHKMKFMNSFESTIYNIPPFLSFWRENAENIITQNVFCVENSSSWMPLAPSDLEPVP